MRERDEIGGRWVEVLDPEPDHRADPDPNFSTAKVVVGATRTIGIFSRVCNASDDGKLCNARTPPPPSDVLRDAADHGSNFVHAFSDWRPDGWSELHVYSNAPVPPAGSNHTRGTDTKTVCLCPRHTLRVAGAVDLKAAT